MTKVVRPGDGRAAPVRRGHEFLTITTFVDGIRNGAGVLLLEGEAGIGKTTLWEAGVARARAHGFHVATARSGQSETALSFAALGDLFTGVPERLVDTLPEPQRRALDIALLRTPAADTVFDPRAIDLATLTVLRHLASESPVLIALDDIQWLDPASAKVITFFLRRLANEQVGVLATRRVGDGASHNVDFDRAPPAELLGRLEVGPLGTSALGAILRDNLQSDLPHSVILKIHALAAGNPFYAIEIGREILRKGVPAPGAPFPVPGDAADLVTDRVQSLSDGTILALRIVAAASRPTLDLLRQTLADDVEPDLAINEAEDAGLITVRAGRVRFSHPLFASAIAAGASPPAARAVHERIARVVDDPEEHARHLALSATGPDVEIAAALDAGAVRARRRGAAVVAAELASLAQEFTPEADSEAAVTRTVTAAMFAFEAGDAPRAHDLLEMAIDTTTAGPARAEIMNRVCEISWQDTGRVEQFARRALAEHGDDRGVAASAHIMLAWVWVYRGDLARATEHSESARVLADGQEDLELRSDVSTVGALTEFLAGHGYDALMSEAVALQNAIDEGGLTTGTVYSSARVVQGLTSLWAGDLTAARRYLEDELATYESLGRYVARDELLCYLANLECRSGEWKKAEAYAEECLEIGEESGHLRGRGQNLMPRAWVAALQGDLETARACANEGLELSQRYQDHLAAAANHAVLGFADLSEGQPSAAVAHLRPMIDFLRHMRTAEPGSVPFIGDAVEALILSGHLDEAETVAADDRLMGRMSSHDGGLACVLRVPGLVAAARGDLNSALDSLTEAVEEPHALSRPFELARTLLVKGETERRARHHARALADLKEARALFEGLGADLWVRQAQSGLARVMSAPTTIHGLSPTERQLATLVCQGKTNRECADLLFLSVKTIESNLSRIYRKLGVRSRSELVSAFLAAGRDAEDPERR